jgi:hypothetical protein
MIRPRLKGEPNSRSGHEGYVNGRTGEAKG